MIRTIIAVAILILVVLFLPVWVQVAFFVIAVITTRYRLMLFIPAVFADVLYRPVDSFSFSYIKMTLIVAGLLVLHWLIIKKTRFRQLIYGLEAE